MNRTPNPQLARAEQQVLLSAYMARQVPGDRQVLTDDVLQAALTGAPALSREQLAALKASPLTLCRLRYLEAQRLAAAQAGQADDAEASTTGSNASVHALQTSAGKATDAHANRWQRSTGELLAAAGTEIDCSLPSADGLWTLSAWTRGNTTRLRLNLRRPADDDSQLSLRLDPEMEVGVLDGRGATLMLGHLDDEGELEVLLDHPLNLRGHLAQHGGEWSVERV